MQEVRLATGALVSAHSRGQQARAGRVAADGVSLYTRLVDPLFVEAAAIQREAGELGAKTVLIGGLAVRALVGSLSRRTLDVDLVTEDATGLESLARVLEARGCQTRRSSPWWRFQRVAPRLIVDASDRDVVDPRTFDRYRVELARGTEQRLADGTIIVCAAVDDLLVLKLLAGRDQDLVDAALLAAHASPAPDASSIARRTEAQDLERAVAGAVLRAELAVSQGSLREAYSLLLARDLPESDERALAQVLDRLKRGAP
jgi:hypothetical protein